MAILTGKHILFEPTLHKTIYKLCGSEEPQRNTNKILPVSGLVSLHMVPLKALTNSLTGFLFQAMKNKKPYFRKKSSAGLAELPFNKLYEPIITDNRISMGAKVLFTDIVNLCKNRGKCCTASNQYFAHRYKVGTDAIKAWLKQLQMTAFIICSGRRGRKIYVNMPALRDFHFNGVNITPKEAEPIGVKITPYDKEGMKSPELVGNKEKES